MHVAVRPSALSLCLALCVGAHATSAYATGIWKAFVPESVEGDFGSHHPMGLIAGKAIVADCSLNWQDQDGRRYCFSSATSLNYFLDQPQTNVGRAHIAWEKHCAGSGETQSRPPSTGCP